MLDRQLVSSQTQSSIPGVSKRGRGDCSDELCALERNSDVLISPSYNCASCYAVLKKKKILVLAGNIICVVCLNTEVGYAIKTVTLVLNLILLRFH